MQAVILDGVLSADFEDEMTMMFKLRLERSS